MVRVVALSSTWFLDVDACMWLIERSAFDEEST